MSRIVIVGAGLSGLAAGWRMHQAGHEVVVAEQSEDVGGSARSVRHGEYLIDTGPDLINTAYARFLALAREVGLGDDIVHSSSRVDVIRDGRPIGFDSARPLSLMRNSLLSRRGKARLALGHLRTRRQVNRIDPFALTRYTDENAQAAQPFSHAAFGPEVSDHLIDPIVRAFAGTGLQHTSALAVLGALAVGREDMLSIKGGMGAVPAAIAERLDIRCGTLVSACAYLGNDSSSRAAARSPPRTARSMDPDPNRVDVTWTRACGSALRSCALRSQNPGVGR